MRGCLGDRCGDCIVPGKGRFGTRVEEFVFTAPSKSKLAFDLLAMVNTCRLAVYADDGAPERVQCLKELRACRYWMRADGAMSWGVPASQGHDDFVASLALCARAAESSAPPPLSGLVRPPRPERERRAW